MDSKSIPLIRLEIEHMKHSILHHMGLRNSDLGDAIEAEIDKALACYPWETAVRKIVHQQITDQVEWFFKYGEGATAIRESLEAAVKELK